MKKLKKVGNAIRKVMIAILGVIFMLLMVMIIWIVPKLIRNYTFVKMTGLDKMVQRDSEQAWDSNSDDLVQIIDSLYED